MYYNYLSNNSVNFIAFQLSQFGTSHFPKCDIISYIGGISDLTSIEKWKQSVSVNGATAKNNSIKTLVILLSTTGGSARAVEKMVEITRYFYEEVYFVILDQAMSAGTIWAMSGDKIYMNYASSLGPIDPQVPSHNGNWVPALGYLDKVNELIEKSRTNSITSAELMMLQNLDLATLRSYEQSAELSRALLEKWLVKYKFKDWNAHSDGNCVTMEDKKNRATEIANKLGDNKIWHSHGRYIGIKTLEEQLKLKIDDFSQNSDMCAMSDQIRYSLHEYITMFPQGELIVYAYRYPQPAIG